MANNVGQFESLRGIAASWVVLSHAMAIAEVEVWPFSDGGLAVDVFIVLSGFVITLLIKRRPEPYFGYIFRRWMRVYPLYLIALALGIATQQFAPQAFSPIIFGSVADPSWYAVITGAAIIPHLLLHLCMLHGVVPDAVLMNAKTAFSGPLWSISLEWQFYLTAPLFVFLLDFRRRWLIATLTVIAIVAAQLAAKRVWQLELPAFLPLRMLVFAVGIISGHFWESARQTSIVRVSSVWSAWIFLLWVTHHSYLSFIPWAIVYTIAAGSDRYDWIGPANRLFLLPSIRWIGERSYGIYVLHLPIMLTVAALFVVPNAHKLGQAMTLICLAATFPVTVAFAALLYRLVEKPLILWARGVEVRWMSFARNH